MQPKTRSWLNALAPIAIVLAIAVPHAQAQVVFLDDAEIYIEINDTDGDAGIQVFLDGEDWQRLAIRDPNHNKILTVQGNGSVGMQGLTELFFESAEPSFDEQPLEELLALFPEGEYLILGRTTEGERLLGLAEMTHALPAGPVQVFPIDGEEVDPDSLELVWLAVPDPPGSKIVRYEIVVETEDDPLRVLKADVSAETTSLSVPPEFLAPGTAYKWEVLAVEESHNQTIPEAEFETEG
jgi:hypothetical protein